MKKILVSMILSIMLIFITITPAFAEVYHGDVNFDNFKYEHYSLNEMNKLSDKLGLLITQSNKSDEIWDCIEDMMLEIDYIQSLYTYAQIQVSIDYTNKYYISEKDYNNNLYSDAIDVMGLAISKALKSDYRKELLDDDFFYLEYYDDYVVDESQNNSKLSEYLTQYYNIYEDISNIDNLSNDKYNKLKNKLADIYSNIISTYRDIYKDYNTYFVYYWNRDFSTEEIKEMREYIKKYIVPLYADLDKNGETTDILYTYKKNMDEKSILDNINKYMGDISSDMKTAFDYMRKLNLYYIGREKNNIDEGYTTELYYYNEPYIYLYGLGNFFDFKSMIHEFGHFYHYYNDDNYTMNVSSDLEASEVHSQALELLFLDYYDEIFGDEAYPLRKAMLCDMLGSIVQGCFVDEFEQTVFDSKNTKWSADELSELFGNLSKEYGLYESGFDADSWMLIPHIYESPGYYISYAVSALIALDIWENSLTDKEGAVQQYLDFEYLSDYNYLQDIINEVKLENVFSENYVKGIETTIKDYLDNPNNTTTNPSDIIEDTTDSTSLYMNTQVFIFIMIFVVSLGIVVVIGLVLMKIR